MKIKLCTAYAGSHFSHKPGDVIDVDDAEGRRHIANGNGFEHIETAVDETREQRGALSLDEARALVAKLEAEQEDPEKPKRGGRRRADKPAEEGGGEQ